VRDFRMGFVNGEALRILPYALCLTMNDCNANIRAHISSGGIAGGGGGRSDV